MAVVYKRFAVAVCKFDLLSLCFVSGRDVFLKEFPQEFILGRRWRWKPVGARWVWRRFGTAVTDRPRAEQQELSSTSLLIRSSESHEPRFHILTPWFCLTVTHHSRLTRAESVWSLQSAVQVRRASGFIQVIIVFHL